MIHHLRIQNFKSLRDVAVDLSPVTVLVGRSGTGKTNLVSAVRFLRDSLTGDVSGNRHVAPGDVRCATNPTGLLRFEVEFEIAGFERRFRYEVQRGADHAHPVHLEKLSFGDSVQFCQSHDDRRGTTWLTPPALVSPPPPGPLAIGRLPGLELVVVAYSALTQGIGVYSFPFDVCGGGAQSNGRQGLRDFGENYLAVLKDLASNLQNVVPRRSIAAALRRINPSVASVELDSIQNPTTAIVGHTLKDKTLPIDLRLESDGFRRFYAHLLAIYQMPPKQTLVFEEPENGIYPGALSLLADEFLAAPEAGRGQVILTTHSPALLDQFTAEQIRVVDLVDLETRIGPLAEEQRAALADELLHAGELLTVDPARLETVAP